MLNKTLNSKPRLKHKLLHVQLRNVSIMLYASRRKHLHKNHVLPRSLYFDFLVVINELKQLDLHLTFPSLLKSKPMCFQLGS